MSLQDFKDDISIAACGMTAKEAQTKGICIECKLPAAVKCHTDAGRSEYLILFADEEE